MGFTTCELSAQPRTAVPLPLPVKPDEKQAELQNELIRISRLARQAETDNDNERAYSLWLAVQKLSPGYMSAYHGIKRALTNLNRPDELLSYLDNMQKEAETGRIAVLPTTVAADRVEVLFNAQRSADADAEIQRLLQKYRGTERIYQEISNLYAAQNQSAQAIAMLHRGREECGNPFLYALDLAGWAESRMDWATAVEEYLQYMEESEGRLTYVVSAVGDLAAHPDADSIAVAVLGKHLAGAPPRTTETLRRLLAALHFRNRRYAQALEQYKLLEASDANPGREILDFARMVRDESECLLALEAYNEALLRSNNIDLKIEALLGKGMTAEKLGWADSAEVFYNQVLAPGAPNPAVFQAYWQLGRIQTQIHRRPDQARELFNKAVVAAGKVRLPASEVDPLLVDMALTWAYEGKLEVTKKALEDLVRKSVPRSPSLAGARYYLARVAFWNGDAEGLKRECDGLLAANASSSPANETVHWKSLTVLLKDSPELLKSLGKADYIFFLGDYPQARNSLDILLDTVRADFQEEIMWQIYYLEQGQLHWTEARSFLDRIIALPTALKADRALLSAGDISYTYMNDAGKALDYYENLLIRFPDSPLVDSARRQLRRVPEIPAKETTISPLN